MSDSKLMPVSYYNVSQGIRLTAYADTVIMEQAGKETILRAIRFGGYPESVQAMSDALYAGARFEVTINGKLHSLKSETKRYDRQVSRDGVYAEATLLAKDDDQNAKKNENNEEGEEERTRDNL